MGLTGDGARTLFDLTHILPADAGLLDELNRSPTTTSVARRRSSSGRRSPATRPRSSSARGSPRRSTILGTHLQQILSGEKSAEDGMSEAAEEMRSKLQEELRRDWHGPRSCRHWRGGRRRARSTAGGAVPRPTSLSRRSTSIFLAFGLLPIIFSLGVSLYDWRGMTPGDFVGLANYQVLLHDPAFYKALWNTVVRLARLRAADDLAGACLRRLAQLPAGPLPRLLPHRLLPAGRHLAGDHRSHLQLPLQPDLRAGQPPARAVRRRLRSTGCPTPPG